MFLSKNKHSTVQGAKHEAVNELILTFAKSSNPIEIIEHVASEDGGHIVTNNNTEVEVEVEVEGEANDVSLDECVIVNTSDELRNTSNQPCSGCVNNSQQISELWQKLTALESKAQCGKHSQQGCASCDRLTSKKNVKVY